jgi:hypothetical protein
VVVTGATMPVIHHLGVEMVEMVQYISPTPKSPIYT